MTNEMRREAAIYASVKKAVLALGIVKLKKLPFFGSQNTDKEQGKKESHD